MAIITLLTDFGLQDEYVGLMKAVIASINPKASIIDITHGIDSQDIVQAAYILKSAYPYFPPGGIHVVVVDPGVGSQRRAIAVKCPNGIFVAPDNGVLSLVLEGNRIESAVKITDSSFFRQPVSHTFHGRDIFAPVAGHLSLGIDISRLGPRISSRQLAVIDLPRPGVRSDRVLYGQIVARDRFGNLLTNIDADQLTRFCRPELWQRLAIKIAHRTIDGICETYACVAPENLLAAIGSRGYLEISVNRGDAGRILKVSKGEPVVVTRPNEPDAQL